MIVGILTAYVIFLAASACWKLQVLPAKILGFRAFNTVKDKIRGRTNAWFFLLFGAQYIRDGYAKAKGEPFIIEAPDINYVMITSPKHLKDINAARDDQLSLYAASKQMFMPTYTMNGFNWHDHRGKDNLGFIRALKGMSMEYLPARVPSFMCLVEQQMTQIMATYKKVGDAIHSPVYPLVRRIVAELNSDLFFGREASDDNEFLEAAIDFIEDVLKIAEVLRLLPSFLVPVVGRWMAPKDHAQRRIFDSLLKIVEQRLEVKSMQSADVGGLDKPNDCVQWIIDASPKKNPWTAERIVYEIMALWFGALHAVAMTLTYALFDLCLHPEYITSLRAEVESAGYDRFLETAQGLPLMDSFIKESARLTPFELVTTRRRALQDFVFTGGSTVKKGDWTTVPFQAFNRDGNIFPSPNEFHGFRFACASPLVTPALNLLVQPEGPSIYMEPSDTWHLWGTGKMTCPGRFYAAVIIKIVLAHVLLNYEVELVDKAAPRTWSWRTTVTPRSDVMIAFRPRNLVVV